MLQREPELAWTASEPTTSWKAVRQVNPSPPLSTVPDSVPRWFAIYTMPRHEKFAARNFSQREIECFLPVYEKATVWKNRQTVRTSLPLFPRYVFARFDWTRRLPVLQTPGVREIVGAGAQPIAVTDLEIEFLRMETGKQVVEPYADLVLGKRVAIKSGPMAGIEGVLIHRGGGDRFIFTLHLIQKSVSIQIGAEDLEMLDA